MGYISYIIYVMQEKYSLRGISIILISFVILSVSIFNIFLYVTARPLLQEKLSLALKRKVEIGYISCFNLRGLTIKYLVIYNAANNYPLYYFKELTIKLSIPALIFEKKLKFSSEVFPTKKFKAHIYAAGSYNFKANELAIKFKLKDVPYTKGLGSIYGTLRLYKKEMPDKSGYPTDLLELTFTSEKMILIAMAEIINRNGQTELIGKIYAPFIRPDKIQFVNVLADIAIVNDKLYVYNLTSSLHKGLLTLDGYIDLDNPLNPFAISADIKNLDISDFSKNSSLFKKEINGAASVIIKLKGSFGHTESLFGKAWLEIKDANLWESTIFKGIANALMIPALKTVVFTNAYGAFQVKNSKIYTNNFKLVSSPIELSAKGNIGFNSLIDASIKIKFKKELIETSNWFSKLSSILLESAGWFLGNVKISGPINEPDFTVTPIGVGNIFEKVKKTIDKFKDILK